MEPARFVGGATCAECHPDATALWSESHHARAMELADANTVLADFDGASFRGNGLSAEFRQEDGAFIIATEDEDGERRDFQVEYTFGLEPLQQYLVALDGGRYQAVNIAWDTRSAEEGGQRWFHLYPDQNVPPGDELHWTGPAMNWNYMCAECHSTDLQKNYDVATNTFDTTWQDVNVNCEACHGPGSRHVDWARARPADAAPVAPEEDMGLVLSLDDGDPEWRIDEATGLAERFPALAANVQVESCGRCHARRSTQAEYTHGQPLTQTHRVALLEEGLYFPDGQIRDEVYVYGSFLQSRMYAKGVTCSDCHEPHRGDVLVDGNGLCNRCHLGAMFDTFEHTRHDAGTEGATCVDCHMPERTYMVVDDRRDHSLRIPRPDLSDELGTPNACTNCHTDQSNGWAAARVAEWFPDSDLRGPHYGQTLAAGRAGEPAAVGALADLADDWEHPAIARATALSLLAQYPGAASGDAVRRGLGNSDALIRAAAVGALRGFGTSTRLELAYDLLRDRNRSVRLQAARTLADLPLGQLPPLQRDTIVAGVDELIEALEVNASRAEFQINIGVLYAQTGRLAEAEAAYRLAIRQDPRAVAGRVNLADLYRTQGRDAEGEILLREALELQPGNADVNHALGLLLVRRGRRPEAVEFLDTAWRLRPETPTYGVAYALLLDGQGDLAGALEILRQVDRRHPADPETLSALVQASRKANDNAAALEYARRLRDLLPRDRGVQQLVQQLENAQVG